MFDEASQAFVKFLGTTKYRQELSASIIEEIEDDGIHWAVCYPTNRRPRSVRDGDVIFMGRLTHGPNDIRIFGRAIALAYVPGRDDATPADINRRPWKADWPRYIRVHQAEFVAGTLEDGVSLNELMDTLGTDSFASTQLHAATGNGNTNPRLAYARQAAVQLSDKGLSWLGERLQAAFDLHGKVPWDYLEKLD